MNTEMVRLVNGALLDVNKAYDRIEDTADIDSERLDEVYVMLKQCRNLLNKELKELEDE